MNPYQLRPKEKIDELLLLVTVYSYAKEHGLPPTADVLMGLKSEFAPSLIRVDTLRMWLNRHKNRTIRRIGICRPYRYELNRQGEKRIVFLMERSLRTAISSKQLGLLAGRDMVKLYFATIDLEKTVEKDLLLFGLLLQSLRLESIVS